MKNDLSKHPCFNDKARHTYGRIHLPVAPRCNIQCNFCNRSFNCMNESRPGVTSRILSPEKALLYLESAKAKLPNLTVTGIAGPGDPFANAPETMRTLELVRERYPDMLLCVASNGLNAGPYVERMAELGVSHVTLTVNAVDPETGGKIYSWVRANKRVCWGTEGAEILLNKQMEVIKGLKKAGITVKINTIIIPGINENYIDVIAKQMAAAGADIFNAIPLIPVKDTLFENLSPPAAGEVKEIRQKAEVYLPQMRHCTRCRADAVGLLGEDLNNKLMAGTETSPQCPAPKEREKLSRVSEERPYIAVTSREGMLVNQHLGEAKQVFLYSFDNGEPEFIEARELPPKGDGRDRWIKLARILEDCSLIIVEGIGQNPEKILNQSGISTLVVEGVINDILNKIYTNKEIKHLFKRKITVCGMSCNGNRGGCI